jgi:hypothetical protein
MKIPIRSMISAPPGYYLLSFDLSQAETWIVAHLANEKKMKFELAEGDIHSATARVIYGIPDKDEHGNWIRKGHILMPDTKRYIGKKSNHANSYRQGYLLYTSEVNKEGTVTISNSEGKRHHTIWHQTYNVKDWWTDIELSLKNFHFLVTPYGRKRYFYSALGPDLYKEATAFIPQSTVADHLFGKVQKENPIEGGLLAIHRKILAKSGTEIRCINTAHDSAIFEVKETIDRNDIASQITSYLRRSLIVNGEQFTIPVDCEIGERWGELEKLKVA